LPRQIWALPCSQQRGSRRGGITRRQDLNVPFRRAASLRLLQRGRAERHRGGANNESNWRGILDYFAPAVQLGLTATPKRKDNVGTYAYFGDPVYIYSLKDGINDGFLTPFKVRQISTTLDEYVLHTGRQVDRGGDRNREALHGDRLQQDHRDQGTGSTATQGHALGVRDLINQMKTSHDPSYCQRGTANDGALGEQRAASWLGAAWSIRTPSAPRDTWVSPVPAAEKRRAVGRSSGGPAVQRVQLSHGRWSPA